MADMKPHRGTMILIFGILGIVCCGPIFGTMALIMGNKDLAEMAAGRMDPSGQGTTNAGKICGIIGLVIFVIWLILNIAGVLAFELPQ